jgi:hypothetical protein
MQGKMPLFRNWINKGEDMSDTRKTPTGFFSFPELGFMGLLAILAVVSGTYGPQYLLPGGSTSGFVYSFLNLPGPGAGVLIFGGITCFWLILALIILKKPWTAIVVSIIIIAMNLLIAEELNFATLDVILVVALIIEGLCLLPVDRKPWSSLIPILLVILGLITLMVLVVGQAKTGEDGALATGFSPGYAFFGILSLVFALICYRYPSRYLVAGGIANIYYLLHFWLFWGEDGGTRFPVSLDIIPVLVLVALTGGILFSMVACGVELLYRSYTGESEEGLSKTE